MAEQTPLGRLKAGLIALLVDAIENGVTIVDKETGEPVRITCPAPILNTAAKVVKDFHQEVGNDPSINELNELVKKYQLRKQAGERPAAH